MRLMNPVAVRARLALLTIFRDLGIPAGDVLSIGEISRTWSDYGVRACDLAPALDSLLREGLLVLEPGSQDVLALTAMGERWLRRQPAWLKQQLLVKRIAARRRRKRGEETDPGVACRRIEDVAPQVAGC
jgi:hypothetical protein